MIENNFDKYSFPKDKFQFARSGVKLHDAKLQTKPRGYFKDAWIRFKKNKSSVVAAIIIIFLVLYAIVAPIISPYTMDDKEARYAFCPPFVEGSTWLFTGTKAETINEITVNKYRYHELEMSFGGNDEIILFKLNNYSEDERGRSIYEYQVQQYYKIGVTYKLLNLEQLNALMDYQVETGKQVIFPSVNKSNIPSSLVATGEQEAARYWYEYERDEDGNFVRDEYRNYIVKLDERNQPIPTYVELESRESETIYYGPRIEDNPVYRQYLGLEDGEEITYSYYERTGTGGNTYKIRVSHYEYYIYQNGSTTPLFFFGTDIYGRDIFSSLGRGARFSLLLAVGISVINLTLGAIYGAIEGYYGGWVDIIMERISDILAGVPMMVVITLFQLHLAQSMGVVPAFLLAFIATGWIGMAALVRKQFYRFKGQEYILVAKSLGARDGRIMFKHIFPNSLGTIITSCALTIPSVIRTETNLTYLGIVNLAESGMTSVGVMISEANTALTTSPHAMFYPSLFLSLMLIAFNLFGNGLRDAFNPSLRGSED